MITGLTKHCIDWMTANISDHNACSFWAVAELFGHLQMVPWIKDYICSHASGVVISATFSSLPRRLLHELLSSRHLLVLEHILYVACINWAKNNCMESGTIVSGLSIRTALGDCLGLIRFPIMERGIFDELMVEYPDVLTVTEQSFVRTSQDTHEVSFWTRDTAAKRLQKCRYFEMPLAYIMHHEHKPAVANGDFRFDQRMRRSSKDGEHFPKYYT